MAMAQMIAKKNRRLTRDTFCLEFIATSALNGPAEPSVLLEYVHAEAESHSRSRRFLAVLSKNTVELSSVKPALVRRYGSNGASKDEFD
jgi:hypothetical protein